MKTSLFILIWSLALPVIADDVYMTVDENGNPSFTDQPVEGSKKIEVKDVTTIPALKNASPPRRNSEPLPRYRTLAITTPVEDETYFRSEGALSISVQVNPRLRSGDTYVFYLDGQKVYSGKSSSHSIAEMDRGTHSVRVAVVGRNGDEVISSDTVTFHMRQPSVLNR